jgi:CRP-like cAMP-binding protein
MTNKGQAVRICSMDQNQFFGELAVLGDGIRSANVIAEEDTSLLVLRRRDALNNYWVYSQKVIQNLL